MLWVEPDLAVSLISLLIIYFIFCRFDVVLARNRKVRRITIIEHALRSVYVNNIGRMRMTENVLDRYLNFKKLLFLPIKKCTKRCSYHSKNLKPTQTKTSISRSHDTLFTHPDRCFPLNCHLIARGFH